MVAKNLAQAELAPSQSSSKAKSFLLLTLISLHDLHLGFLTLRLVDHRLTSRGTVSACTRTRLAMIM